MPASTYTHGYELIVQEPLTKSKFIQLCRALTEAFNKNYETDEFSFEPEPITEGGIVFANYRGIFKTMRVFPLEGGKLYGYLPGNVMDAWENDHEVLHSGVLGTFLKSFHGAPLWTIHELEIFEKCFNRFGIYVTGKYPAKKDLSMNGHICGDPRV